MSEQDSGYKWFVDDMSEILGTCWHINAAGEIWFHNAISSDISMYPCLEVMQQDTFNLREVNQKTALGMLR